MTDADRQLLSSMNISRRFARTDNFHHPFLTAFALFNFATHDSAFSVFRRRAREQHSCSEPESWSFLVAVDGQNISQLV